MNRSPNIIMQMTACHVFQSTSVSYSRGTYKVKSESTVIIHGIGFSKKNRPLGDSIQPRSL